MSSSSTQRRRLAAERLLAQLRRTPGDPERAVDAASSGASGSGSSAATYAGAPVARTSAVPKRSRLGGDELDRHALDRHPDGAPRAPARPPRRSGAARRSARARRTDPARRRPPRAARTRRASAARRRPARRRAASAMPADELPRAIEQKRALRSRLAPRGRAPRAAAPRSSARSPARSAAARPPPPRAARSGVRTPSACAISIERLALEPEVAAEADETGRQLALELGQLGDVARLDELAQPRLDPRRRSRAARAPCRLRTSSATGTGARADRLGGAAVGAGRVGIRLGELEQRRERVQPVRDPGVVHRRAGAATAPAAA